MRTPGNEKLFAARVAKGWFSQEAAAEGISDAGRDALRNPDFSVGVRTYRRWEAANPAWPRPDRATALRAAFGRGPEHLGFQPPVPLHIDETARGPEAIDPVDRRQALSTAAAVIGLPWLASSPYAAATGTAHPIRIGRDEIDELHATAADLDAIDQQFGGDRLWRVAHSHLQRVHQLIDHATYGEDIGRELHGIAGQLTTSLGWFCYDADRQPAARMYFSEALNTAMLAGDEALATRTLSNMARQAVDLGKPREAVRFARTAQRHAGDWGATPRVSALLAIRLAQGYAAMGDEMNCTAAIRRAWKYFDRGTDDRDPDWTAFLNEAELVCLEGMCHLDLGRHKRAVRNLERSASLQVVAHSRNRGMCLAKLSMAALRSRDVDRTVAAATESVRLISSGMTSARNRRQLTLVRDGLHRYRDHPQARETLVLIDHHIA